MATDFKKAPRPRNSLDNSKFHLVAKNEKGFRAKLIPELVGNNPRFTIYTGLEEDKDNNFGRIQAKLDAPTFMLIVDRLEDMARKGEGKKIYSIDNMKQVFKDKKPSNDWYPENTVKFGRDEDGQIWISVIEKNRPKLKFVLTNPQYHILKNADGTDLAPGEVSRLYTLAWTGVMRAIIGPCLNTNYTPPPPRDNGGNGGGQRSGGGGYSGGNSGGGNGGGFRNNGGSQSRSNQTGGGEASDTYEGEIDGDLWS